MTKEELFQSFMNKLSIEEIHPLHKAMIEECCETALKNNPGIKDKKTLILVVQTAFLTSDKTLKATLNSSFKFTGADQITLNYRDQTFKIPKDSRLLK